MSFITTIQHAVASVVQEAVKVEKATASLASKAADLMRKAQVAEPTIESITAGVAAAIGKPALGVAAVNAERLAFASLGVLIPLVADTSAAAQEQFKNLVKDEALAADLRAAAPQILAAVKGQGLLVQ